MSAFDHTHIDQKWQKKWLESGVFNASDSTDKPKYYPLIEFPYPSGAGLHVGHPRPYIGLDIVARKRRGEGYNVLYPIGWDAFGLPTENYAIKTGRHPRDITKENTDTFRRQIQALGVSFDWSREINTTDPAYYAWTQWIFLQLYKKGLAYKAKTTINWCPKDKIGLANEEVVDGACERCGTPVEKREKEQWMLAITKYAQRLYDDLDTVDYIERAKTQQRNWIGPSEGALISFKVIVEGQAAPNFLLLHGYGGSPKKDFFPWLKKTLEADGFSVQVPDLPHTDDPSEEEQVSYVLKNCAIDENTIIVGHSLGCVLARRALVKHGKPVRGLVQIASAVPPSIKEKPYQKNFTWEEDFETLGTLARYSVVAADTKEAWRMPYLKTLADSIKRPLRADESKTEHFCGKEEPALLRWIFPSITVFTTRPDTLFGATYMVLAPELRYVDHLPITNRDEVEAYRQEALAKTEMERTAEGKEKTGVELKGIKAINPATKEEIPIYIADYVLAGYGTGAIMAVPAHDVRDNAFAKKFGLPMRTVIEPKFYASGSDLAEVHKNTAVREGEPFVKREAVCAVVRNPKDNTYLCVSWKGEHMNGLVTGGIDDGEDIVEAAKREVHEETGYKNLKHVDAPVWVINTYFYHRLKKQNRHAHFHFIFFDLIDDAQDPVDEKEAAIHDIVWKKKEELKNFFTVYEGDFVVALLENPNYLHTGAGVLARSGEFDGLDSEESKKKITEAVGGRIITTYKLRDWVFSRQRYWGEPIPMIYCEKCRWVPVPEDQLPVTLPEVEKYEPTDTGESPLANISEFVNTVCPSCGGSAKRETDVMPNWAGSSWYYLRYTDPANKKAIADTKKLGYWTPVDWYNGGMEHTVLHLLYSRFWHKFLFDIGVVPTSEPYKKRTSHGIILAEGGEKMSKSKGNVVNPDEVIARFGADALRVYEMFMGPFDQAIAWSTDGLVGTRRFLERVHTLSERVSDDAPDQSMLTLMHQTIKKVSEDIEELKMNTAVSALMIFTNELHKRESVPRDVFRTLLLLLGPFAPHLSEELWEGLGEAVMLAEAPWPVFDATLVKGTEVSIAIQINGKTKGVIKAPIGTSEKEALNKAMELGPVAALLDKKPSMRLIYIPDRLLNIVV